MLATKKLVLTYFFNTHILIALIDLLASAPIKLLLEKW